jgi:hypothetical protein
MARGPRYDAGVRSFCVTLAAWLGFVGIFFGAPLAARAQSGPAPAPYAPPGAPDPWAAPPPGGGAPPFAGGPPPYGYGPPPALRLMAYENDKKNEAVALLLDLFIPGVGSIYADHAVGALVTWGGMIGGLALIVAGVDQGLGSDDATAHSSNDGVGLVLFGAAAIVGFRIYGIVDAYRSAKDYNARLAQSLGLSGVGLSLAPLRTPQGTALAPTLTLRF